MFIQTSANIGRESGIAVSISAFRDINSVGKEHHMSQFSCPLKVIRTTEIPFQMN